MRMYDLIHKKREGLELSAEEIAWFVQGYARDEIPDYQASALCMAIWFRGMTDAETVELTKQIAASGDTVDLSMFGDRSVDKHSTGGVGDKASLIVGPIVASLGGKVTKMSGRGLGHTGGTVDKLESIPGYRTSLSREAFLSQVEQVGLAIIGQSEDLTPADKKLYALRDVTATVDSIPLITSSVMGKKLASGSQTIVLDVTVGSGAFMKTPEEAGVLARKMVEIGRSCGRRMGALLTNMDAPLGACVGNSLEIAESVGVLRGEVKGELREVCVELATAMIALLDHQSIDEARVRVNEAIDSGAAYAKMKEWIAAQGGDVSYIEDPSRFPTAPIRQAVLADREGYITAMNAEEIGLVSVLLGAGRSRKEDAIDYAAGLVIEKKIGDYVRVGDVLCTLHTAKPDAVGKATADYLAALTVGPEKAPVKPLIYETIL